LFNINTDTNGNFHIRDVGSPNALWTIPTGEKVVVDFNATWQIYPTRSEIYPNWKVCGAKRPKLEEDKSSTK